MEHLFRGVLTPTLLIDVIADLKPRHTLSGREINSGGGPLN
jgi:hypothetical protein